MLSLQHHQQPPAFQHRPSRSQHAQQHQSPPSSSQQHPPSRTPRPRLEIRSLGALAVQSKHIGMWSDRRDKLPKRLDEMDSEEIRHLLADDLPAEFADEPLAGERQRKLN